MMGGPAERPLLHFSNLQHSNIAKPKMSTFKFDGQDFILPNINPESLLKIRPSLFISYLFAIESNKRYPATSSNKKFLTEAFKKILGHRLGMVRDGPEMQAALQRWKDDKYWSIGHGGMGDPYSTRSNSNIQVDSGMYDAGHDGADDTNHFTEPFSGLKEKGRGLKLYNQGYNPLTKTIQCRYWAQGNCKNSDEDCHYAHFPIYDGVDDPNRMEIGRQYPIPVQDHPGLNQPWNKQFECNFWRRNGFCKWSDEECKYAHYPTGQYRDFGAGANGVETTGEFLKPTQIIGPPEVVQKVVPKFDNTPKDYARPQSTTLKLNELTLSAFFDLFCYTNPTARKEPPWSTVCTFYKDFIMKTFGRDSGRYVLAGYTQTKLPIPPEILKRAISYIQNEIDKDPILRRSSVVQMNQENAPGASLKRGRNEEIAATPPKRPKVESDSRDLQAEDGEIVSKPEHQNIHRDRVTLQEQVEEPRSAQLYSPSMPNLARTLASFIEPAEKGITDDGSEHHVLRDDYSSPAKDPASAFMLKEDSLLDGLPSSYRTDLRAAGTALKYVSRSSGTHLNAQNSLPGLVSHNSPAITQIRAQESVNAPSQTIPRSAPSLEDIRQGIRDGVLRSPVTMAVNGHKGHSPPTSNVVNENRPTSNGRLGDERNPHDNLRIAPRHAYYSPTTMRTTNDRMPPSPEIKRAHDPHSPQAGYTREMRAPTHVHTTPAPTYSSLTYLEPTQQEPLSAPFVRIEVMLNGALTEATQQPVSAHSIRTEAMIKGALTDLEALKRRVLQ